MKNFKVVIIIFLMGFLFSHLFDCVSMCDAENSRITIKGIITNIKKAKEHLSPKTCLQLIRVPEDGNLEGTTDNSGRLAYKSDLAKIPVPKDGKFAFITEDLLPGKYLIVLQYFQRAILSGSPQPSAILAKEGNWLNVDVPTDTKRPLVIDVGSTYIRFP
jgi:hypothetical protein